MFRAMLLEQDGDKIAASIQDLPESRLPHYPDDGEVTVAVDYSTLNYKDGMILNGLGRLVRQYPHIPGVDLAGTVEKSSHPAYQTGDSVLLTGWRVGERYWGGYAQKARVKGEWLVPLPDGLTAKRAMSIGTAGFTAMLAIMALEEHGVTPASGEVLVTGAAGGVGSVAVAVLAKLGYRVAASTGRPATHDYLTSLGAANILSREELAEPSKRPLDSERWAGCIDSVGGTTLARVLTQMRYGGAVAAVGLAGGPAFETTVLPFLLRGVSLLGIDSVMCPTERRLTAWQRLVTDLPLEMLDSITTTAGLADTPRLAEDILKGQVRGRLVIDVNG
jgi:acrylyl-CoA reductase (NADPH)